MNGMEKRDSPDVANAAKTGASEHRKSPGASAGPGQKAAPVPGDGKRAQKSEKTASHVIRQTAADAAHQRIREDEEDNTGLQAVHESEQVTETVWQHGSNAAESWRHHQANAAERQEGASNPLSHRQQKRNLKRLYISERRNGSGRTAISRGARHSVEKARASAEEMIRRAASKKRMIPLLALGGLLVFVMYSISACAPMMNAALTTLSMGTYPAEESDVRFAEAIYAQMEQALLDEMERPDQCYPGYDEYIVDAQEIGHDPYALVSLISAYLNGEAWTADSAYPVIDMLFQWQYRKEVTFTTEQRYATETVDGQEISVLYDAHICTVTLKNNTLSHAPLYVMDEERVGLYALYMSTLGNMPEVFAGDPHASTLKEPLIYEVPQEMLDADPRFAAIITEANKYLGYPYVWGGYNPTTSFDCAGFISWVFTQTGVANIGRWGAAGIFASCQKIAASQARPGDLVFFEGTIEGETGVTHCGIYVGEHRMIHCSDPCSYADLTEPYWQQHLVGYGRVY